MKRIRLGSGDGLQTALREAVRILRDGGVVAFPTETVYGLCVDARNRDAVARLYALKGRDTRRASALLLPDRASAERFVGGLPPLARRLADRFWPGPLTLVVRGRKGGLVGLRLPDHGLARGLAAAAGVPLLQTSANLSGRPAALNAAAVVASLGTRFDLLLDGGRTPGGRSSSVVRCSEGRFEILREGALSADEITRAAVRVVLVACTGNLCRSPLGEVMLAQAVAERLACPLEELERHGFRFGSFGIMAPADRPASEHAVTVAAEYGLDLRSHRSRPFAIGLVEAADVIYGMAQGHLDFLAPYFDRRPEALRLFDPDGREVADPYGRSIRAYRTAAEQIHAAAARHAEELTDEPSQE